jgi:photosystem II stability/assembly factor-like uncharacterized protein
MWQIEIHTWGRTSGGPGSGLFKSTDGGVTWTRVKGNGLPTKNVGKTVLAIAPSNPQRIYVMMETGDGIPHQVTGEQTENGQVWRSDDGGVHWSLSTRDKNAMGRAHYYSRIAVSPADEDETYYLTAAFSKSIDGGRTLITQQFPNAPGGDHHDIWIDPTNADRMIVAHDQGLSISINRGKTWLKQRLLNAQIYHVTVDNMIPYNVFGNKQDEPTYRGPSNSRIGGFGPRSGGIPRAAWHAVGGGESGWATPDPVDPNIIWSTASGSGMVGGIVVRFEENTRMFRNVEVWPYQSNGPAKDVKYRFVWDSPFLISPHDHNTIYTGSQHVHRSTDGGQSWQVISPDLTLNDRSKMGSSGGLTPDNIGVEYAGVVYGIAESPITKGMIWVGTNDGQVQLTRDNGATWTNLTKNLPGLPAWGSVRSIAPSKWDAATAYLTVDAHQENIRDPFIYRTTDYGRTWKLIVNGIPKSNLSYAKVIIEDPIRRGLLYVGVENGIYLTYDAGDTWQPLQNDLPQAPVSGIQVQGHFNDLVISTYGRGFWILDDITAIQQLTPEIAAAPAHLFPPRATYRFRPITAPSTPYDDPTTGEDPEPGAPITYHLKAAAKATPKLTILDATGAVVRTFDGTNKVGMNRVNWDLRDTPSSELKLLTSPMFAEYIAVGPDGRDAGTPRVAILMPPGQYTVKLTVDGVDYTRPLEVRKDPNSSGSEGDIAEQVKAIQAIRRDIEEGNTAVRRAEAIRLQLSSLIRVAGDASVTADAKALDTKVTDVEMNLVDLRLTGTGQDGVRFGSKLLAKLGYLSNGVSIGDFKPTNQHAEAQGLLHTEVGEQVRALDQLLQRELKGFNDKLRAKGLPTIFDRTAPVP